jgi:hypothetical protein
MLCVIIREPLQRGGKKEAEHEADEHRGTRAPTHSNGSSGARARRQCAGEQHQEQTQV